MSWSAKSSIEYSYKSQTANNPKALKDFRKRYRAIQTIFNTVDGQLQFGSLGCRNCRLMLEKATGTPCYLDWEEYEIEKIAKNADWDFPVFPTDMWAYLCAKSFLEICAKYKLSVKFTSPIGSTTFLK